MHDDKFYENMQKKKTYYPLITVLLFFIVKDKSSESVSKLLRNHYRYQQSIFPQFNGILGEMPVYACLGQFQNRESDLNWLVQLDKKKIKKFETEGSF